MSYKGWILFCFIKKVITTLNILLALSASLTPCIEQDNNIPLMYFGLGILQDLLPGYVCV